MITFEKKKEIEGRFTKYEIARILGARALQLAMNAPVLIKLSKEELEAINYDPIRIAEMEFYEEILPITVRRPLPKKQIERIAKIIKEEEKKEKVKEVEKEKKPEKKIDEEITKEAEGSEIMEIAKPEDEIEEEPASEEGSLE